ncbi:unnamed protein product [Lactuca saligna]|uniref:Uncharacterized protein n=1 Tax=Lactuca saligna TaxID=75948 RepID=A0AA36EE76_LACSI|nr:unnamed protein product [Lactuca saligna]
MAAMNNSRLKETIKTIFRKKLFAARRLARLAQHSSTLYNPFSRPIANFSISRSFFPYLDSNRHSLKESHPLYYNRQIAWAAMVVCVGIRWFAVEDCKKILEGENGEGGGSDGSIRWNGVEWWSRWWNMVVTEKGERDGGWCGDDDRLRWVMVQDWSGSRLIREVVLKVVYKVEKGGCRGSCQR